MTKEATRTMYDDIKPPPAQTVAGDVGAPPKTVSPGSDWRPIATAPRNGSIVSITDNPKAEMGIPSRWHTTREMVRGRWTPAGRWVSAIGRRPIPFTPTVWMPFDG